jgi:hypothetical protein
MRYGVLWWYGGDMIGEDDGYDGYDMVIGSDKWFNDVDEW